VRQYLPWFLGSLGCLLAAGIFLGWSRRGRRRRYTSDRRQWWAG